MKEEATAVRILYAEDDALLRISTVLLLESKCPGCNITAVDDGEACLEVFQSNPGDFDLILTDKDMPGMSGIELIEHLAETAQNMDIPQIILYTGDLGGAVISEKAKEALNIAILSKPTDRNKLIQLVTDMISQ